MNGAEKRWAFFNPTRIEAGTGILKQLPQLVSAGGKGLIVTSPGFTRRGVSAMVKDLLTAGSVEVYDAVEPNPDLVAVETCWQHYRGQGINYIVAVGGGSVLDTAKALSYLLPVEDEGFSLTRHLVDKDPLPEIKPLKLIAIPTTAGTGSEVTPFATIWDHRAKKKYSLSADYLYPTVALLDPELTLSLPKRDTIITGLDTLSHALESVWNRNANPVTISYATQTIYIVLNILPLLVQNLNDINLRAKMLTGSMLSGLCISSTRTALAHSMSYPITSFLGVPHGLACGFTLPALFEFNCAVDDGRFSELARMLGYNSSSELGFHINRMFKVLNINSLVNSYNINIDSLLDLVPEMFTPERAGNNLRLIDKDIVEMILAKAVYNL